MSKRLVGFGELLLRLDAPGNLRFQQADCFECKFTGGEANVLVAARNFGIEDCQIVSAVPDNPIGESCIRFLQQQDIGTNHILVDGERLGILFVETGASLRPTRVVYDRLHTAFRQADPEAYDWKRILDGSGILHVTGTAPALGENVTGALEECMDFTRHGDYQFSFDCSYRSSLWSIEDAARAYRRWARHADILFASPGDAKIFFGIEDPDPRSRLERLAEEYGIRYLAFTTRREPNTSVNHLTGSLLADGRWSESREYEFPVVDRIGAGDAFAGGMLASLMIGKSPEESVEFATAAAVLKHSVVGDFCLVSASEVRELVDGTSLRIRR